MSTLHSPAGPALDALYRAHVAEVYRYAYAVLGNRADAEDVTQTTFVNALRALERGEQPRKPANWLITIAHNLIRQRFRQKAARPSEVELDRDVAAPEGDDGGPSLDELVRALQRIPESQREALVLRELEGRPYKEIAGILDISVTALETLIFRARRSLAEELENLVTCDRAELALSKRHDGRLGLKERRRLAAHLAECGSCARVAATSSRHRKAFKGLAVLPLPLSLSLYGGGPTAAAAAVGTGVLAKVAAGVAAVAVIGGAGYEGAQAVRDADRPAARPAAATPPRQAPVLPIRPFVAERPSAKAAVVPAKAKAKVKVQPKPKPEPAAKAKGPGKPKPARSVQPARGKSASAPGQLRPKPAQAVQKKPR